MSDASISNSSDQRTTLTSELGPRPAHESEAASAATPVAARAGRDFGARSYVRPLTGLASVVAVVVIIALAVAMFRGDFSQTVPITVISDRAGLVMNPDAKVKMNDIQVGSVAAIDQRPDGSAALHLAMNRSELHLIPSNVKVDIASSTVFGAKFVQLTPPTDPSPVSMRAGQVIEGEHVTVEINTIFEQLTSLLSTIQPEKLNQTLTALSSAFSGRGQTIGHAISDLHATLVELDPSLQNLSHDIATAPTVLNTYADAAADLLKITDRFTSISRTIVEEQHGLDELLVSVMGFGDIGNDVLTTNHRPLTDVLHLLAPVTDLTREYDQAIYCALAGVIPLAMVAPPRVPGAEVSASFRGGQTLTAIHRTCRRWPPQADRNAWACPDFPSRRGHRTSSPMSAPTRGNTAMRGYGSTRRASRNSCWAIPSTGRPATPRRLVCRDDSYVARPC